MLHMLYLLLVELIFPAALPDVPAQHTQQLSCQQQLRIVKKLHEFPVYVERAYKMDIVALNRIARTYTTSAFSDILEALGSMKLKDLLHATQSEVNQTYTPVTDELFDQAYKHTQTQTSLEQRTALWMQFIEHCYTCREHMRQQRLPHVWFARQADSSNDELFVRNNQKLKIDTSTQRHLMADSVLSYIPFALIEKYDPQASHVIMHK